ncbi:hypothetical protein PHET_00759 [Paragonimus heterotremus]|uniref:U2A'/phosphoprotein 32 family A C-terminal domain-containing protein n=1 Tax=Paragonimus heterotremus TaxID=100268 RepID=A0A8J4TN72_9TREM|nr:hypothetical protein PHET_00759 [Paragonimus heterotremus]
MSSSEETAASNERQYSQETHDEEAGKYDTNESYAEEALQKQALTKDIIAECISMPYRLGYGFSHAFVKLDCSDRGNRISRFRTVKELDCLPSLKVLSLLDNPICDKDEYRLVVIGILSSLQRLDKDRVTESERNAGRSIALNKLDTEEEESEPEAMEEHHNAEGLAEEMADEGHKAAEEEEHAEEVDEEEEED